MSQSPMQPETTLLPEKQRGHYDEPSKLELLYDGQSFSLMLTSEYDESCSRSIHNLTAAELTQAAIGLLKAAQTVDPDLASQLWHTLGAPRELLTSTVLEMLLSGLRADPQALSALFSYYVPCNSALIEHPQIVTTGGAWLDPNAKVSMIGLINGILNLFDAPRIATRWADGGDPEKLEPATLIGFQRYNPTMGSSVAATGTPG